MSHLSTSLAEFVSYVQTHLTGDEKGESADFLDHLFRAFSQAGREWRIGIWSMRRWPAIPAVVVEEVLATNDANLCANETLQNLKSFNGVAGSMFFRCKNWVFENCEWGFIDIGQGSGDGEAFDFEGNCDNMTMKNCSFHDTDGPGFLLCCYASDGNPNKGIVMENCLINAKSKRPLQPRVKASIFTKCYLKDLKDACRLPKHSARMISSTEGEKQIFQLAFAGPVTINEFKIKEDAASSVARYAIECWDHKQARWINCFNGMGIGAEFVCPIISRSTTKARLVVVRTNKDKAVITSFDAFNEPPGDGFDVSKGGVTPNRVGK